MSFCFRRKFVAMGVIKMIDVIRPIVIHLKISDWWSCIQGVLTWWRKWLDRIWLVFFLGKSEPKKRGKRHFVSTCCHLLFLALIFFVEIQSEFIFICYNYSFESPLVKMRPNPQYKHISYSNCLIHRAYINKNHTATQQPNQHTHTHTHIPIQ